MALFCNRPRQLPFLPSRWSRISFICLLPCRYSLPEPSSKGSFQTKSKQSVDRQTRARVAGEFEFVNCQICVRRRRRRANLCVSHLRPIHHEPRAAIYKISARAGGSIKGGAAVFNVSVCVPRIQREPSAISIRYVVNSLDFLRLNFYSQQVLTA